MESVEAKGATRRLGGRQKQERKQRVSGGQRQSHVIKVLPTHTCNLPVKLDADGIQSTRQHRPS